MKRSFRLTRPSDFQRVRRHGKSFAHPFVVLITSENDRQQPRIGVTASRSVGNAVARNRAKRILREALRPMLSEIKPGYDILLVARAGIRQAKSTDLAEALSSLMKKARVRN